MFFNILKFETCAPRIAETHKSFAMSQTPRKVGSLAFLSLSEVESFALTFNYTIVRLHYEFNKFWD